SSVRWTAIPASGATAERAAEIMKASRFDTLPVESEKGIKEYFQTDIWNDYSSIARRAVTHRGVIPYKTPLRNVIQGFASEARNFYFLRNERRIVGLISIANLNCRQVKVYLIVSAPGDMVDFVSRFFAPRAGVREDPVTGSAHCTLIPYWAARLGKPKLVAKQLSARGGDI